MNKYIFYITWEKERIPKRWWHREKLVRSGDFYTAMGNTKDEAAASIIDKIKDGFQPGFDDSEWFLWSIQEYNIRKVEN